LAFIKRTTGNKIDERMRKPKILVFSVLIVMAVACNKDDDSPSLSAPIATVATDTTNNRFVANWQAVSGANIYELQVSTSTDFSTDLKNLIDLSLTQTNVSALWQNTEYFYRVRARSDNEVVSPFSNVISVITLPNAPIALDASEFSTSSLTINWTTVNGADSYQLFVSSGLCPEQDGSEILEDYDGILVNGNSFILEGLESNTFYYYQVKAVSNGRFSDYSNCKAARTL
jgi:hypothetical protein